MRVTLTGHEIARNEVKKVLTNNEREKLIKDQKTAPDFRLILSPPFNEVNKITDSLYLTGIGGLTKENLENLGFTLIINATYEWPNSSVEGIECIRVPVSIIHNIKFIYYCVKV